MTSHLLGWVDPINMQNRWSDIVNARLETHQALTSLDPRSHRHKGSRHVIPIREVVLRYHRRGLLVIHVSMWVFLLELAERLDPVIGNDEQVGIFVDVFENRT